MAMRQVLFITNSGITAYLQHGHRLERLDFFEPGTSGLGRFEAFLEDQAPLLTYILADLVEEEFRIEVVPHAMGRDRAAILKRHMRRLFRGTTLTHAEVIGRVSGQRHKDEILFSALTNGELPDMWLPVMLKHQVPIAGIYSLPLLTADLLRKMKHRIEDALVLTEGQDGGLRQSFFHKGQLKFSRLSPMPQLTDAEYAEYVHEEIGKTKRYLSNLRLLKPDVLLEVHLLSGGTQLDALLEMKARKGLDHYDMIDLNSFARRFGYRGTIERHFADELMAYHVAAKHPSNHYALPQHRRFYFTQVTRTGLQAASIVLAAGAALWAGINGADGILHSKEAGAALSATQDARARFDQANSLIPNADASPDDVEAAVHIAQYLMTQREQPDGMLGNIGQTLQNHNSLSIDSLEWFVSRDPNARKPATAGDNQQVMDAMEDDGANDGITEQFQIALITGRIEFFDGNYRVAHQRISEFAAELVTRSGIQDVEIISLPLNIDPKSSVAGGLGQDAKTADARFSVRVVRRGNHESL